MDRPKRPSYVSFAKGFIFAGVAVLGAFVAWRFALMTFIALMLCPVAGPWQSYHVSLPGSADITYNIRSLGRGEADTWFVWRSPRGTEHSYFVARYSGYPREDVEFRLAEGGQALLVVGHVQPRYGHLDLSAGEPVIEGALDFRTAKFWDVHGGVHHAGEDRKMSGTIESFPDWARLAYGEPIARWMGVCYSQACRCPVYVHWSPQFKSTFLHAKRLVNGEPYSVVIESGNPIYRLAELRSVYPCQILFVDYSLPHKPRVCATLDCSKGEFIDENRVLWRYTEQPQDTITRLPKVLESYPEWATPRAGEVVARPHSANRYLPRARESEES